MSKSIISHIVAGITAILLSVALVLLLAAQSHIATQLLSYLN